MTADPPLVTFTAVQKRYGGGAIILDGLNLAVQRGEFVSVIGPSGCGKSTLLKLVASLSPVTEGKLIVDGRLPADARREMAFIFQEATLLPWLTVARNIELPMRLRGWSGEKRGVVAENMLRLVGLDQVPDHYPRQLSGGMKMRVSIARALSLSPKILLLDEPFGALDEMTRNRLNEELLAIREQEKFTAFFVTHSVSEAVFLASRVLVMSANPGRFVHDVPVPFGYPRTVETRESPGFQKLVAEISRLLRSGPPAHEKSA